MSRFCLNIHGLMMADVDVSPRLEQQIREDIGYLIVSGKADNPDLVVRDLSPPPAPKDIFAAVRGVKYRFALVNYQNRECIAMLYWDQPIAVFVPGQPRQLLVARKSRNTGRMYLLFLYLLSVALADRQALLLHGACLAPPADEKEENQDAVLFIGRRGSCKSSLDLTLLKNGWRYLGDDKVILSSAVIYPFEKRIGVLDWHLNKLPWLYKALPPRLKRQKSPIRRQLRSFLKSLGKLILPDRLAIEWDDIWNSNCWVPVDRIFPESTVLHQSRIKAVVHLRPSSRLALNQPPRDEVLNRIVSTEEAMFVELTPLPVFCQDYFNTVNRRSYYRILEQNLASIPAYELELPVTAVFDHYENQILNHLNRLT